MAAVVIPAVVGAVKTIGAKVATSALGKAIAGVGAKIASSAAVTGLKTVGANIAKSAVGKAVSGFGSKVASSVVGKGVKAVGSKVVSGLAKVKSSAPIKSFMYDAIDQGTMTMAKNAISGGSQQSFSSSTFSKALSIGEDNISSASSSLTTAAQNARMDAYNNSVFGSSMSLSNTFAGESGGSGIFSSLLKNKNTLN